jgi:hypothetical protein
MKRVLVPGADRGVRRRRSRKNPVEPPATTRSLKQGTGGPGRLAPSCRPRAGCVLRASNPFPLESADAGAREDAPIETSRLLRAFGSIGLTATQASVRTPSSAASRRKGTSFSAMKSDAQKRRLASTTPTRAVANLESVTPTTAERLDPRIPLGSPPRLSDDRSRHRPGGLLPC